jgi:hypothetical protein
VPASASTSRSRRRSRAAARHRRAVSKRDRAPSSRAATTASRSLPVGGTLSVDGASMPVTGRAWLDHEWSDAFLDADAVGWDWIGMNPDDGLGPDRVPPASPRRQCVVRRRELSASRRGRPRLRAVRCDVRGPSPLDPAARRRRPIRSNGPSTRRPGATPSGAARQPGTRQPRQHRRDLLGGPERPVRRERPARRRRLPRDDRATRQR